jgi:hypothetical protein
VIKSIAIPGVLNLDPISSFIVGIHTQCVWLSMRSHDVIPSYNTRIDISTSFFFFFFFFFAFSFFFVLLIANFSITINISKSSVASSSPKS